MSNTTIHTTHNQPGQRLGTVTSPGGRVRVIRRVRYGQNFADGAEAKGYPLDNRNRPVDTDPSTLLADFAEFAPTGHTVE